MAEAKQVAHSTIFKEAIDGGTTFAEVPLVRSIQPPSRTREEIDGRTLNDDFEVPLMGIETASELSITIFWHPGESLHEEWDTAFDAKTEFAVQIVTPHSTPVTDEFNVRIKAMEPAELTPDGTYQRTITMQRTGDITRT